jgi:hypothetical protein
VLQRSVKKPKLNRFDRFLWAWFCGAWADWRVVRKLDLRESAMVSYRSPVVAIMNFE